MHDEPRTVVHSVIEQVQNAGIQIIMATGDHAQTAVYIAKKTGIMSDETKIITGDQLASMTDAQAIDRLQGNFVCARLSPDDKVRLVHLFHQQQKIVVMTGDGNNDVPALAAADISIATKSCATQLAQQASDIILLDDSFENIVYAIKQGRSMVQALRRTILYFLTSNTGEVLIIFFALVGNLPLPLLPSQILWLNLITDGFLDMALAMEPDHVTTLQKIDTKLQPKIFEMTTIIKMFYLSLPMSIAGLITFVSLYQTDIALARTLTLVTLSLFQWFNALNCRSLEKSVWTIGLFSNFWLVVASITVLILQIIVLYVPFAQQIFSTVPLSLNQWIYAIIVASSVLIMEEIRKRIWPFFYRAN